MAGDKPPGVYSDRVGAEAPETMWPVPHPGPFPIAAVATTGWNPRAVRKRRGKVAGRPKVVPQMGLLPIPAAGLEGPQDCRHWPIENSQQFRFRKIVTPNSIGLEPAQLGGWLRGLLWRAFWPSSCGTARHLPALNGTRSVRMGTWTPRVEMSPMIALGCLHPLGYGNRSSLRVSVGKLVHPCSIVTTAELVAKTGFRELHFSRSGSSRNPSGRGSLHDL